MILMVLVQTNNNKNFGFRPQKLEWLGKAETHIFSLVLVRKKD